MVKYPDFSAASLEARAEIAHVMHCWSRTVDRCDWDAVQNVFHHDGQVDYGIYRGDVDGLIAWLSERHKSISRSMHFIGNIFIEFADEDNALVETYSIALQRNSPKDGKTGGQSFDTLVAGRYIDHFQKREGRWRIFRRNVVFDNAQTLPVPASAPPLAKDWLVSTRGEDDPIWSLRVKLGIG